MYSPRLKKRSNARTERRRVLGPCTRLIAETEAEAWAIRHVHAAVAQLETFIEHWLKPFEVLEPRFARIRGGEMQVNLHREVRREAEALEVGQAHDLQERRDAPHAWCIRLDEIRRLRRNQLRMFAEACQHFAGRDRSVKRCAQRRMSFHVVGVQWFFNPSEIELFEHAAKALRCATVPLLVRIDHEREAVTQMLAYGGHPLQVDGCLRLAHLDLDTANAALPRRVDVLDHLFERHRQITARGVVALYRITMRAKQLRERQAGAFCLHVPKRDVERRNGLRRQAAAPHRCTGPAELVPDARNVVRIFADQLGRDLLRMCVHARSAGAFRITETDAFMTAFRADLSEDECDLSQRLLPAGQDLGVADGGRKRQVSQRNLHAGNAVRAGCASRQMGKRVFARRWFRRCAHDFSLRKMDATDGRMNSRSRLLKISLSIYNAGFSRRSARSSAPRSTHARRHRQVRPRTTPCFAAGNQSPPA